VRVLAEDSAIDLSVWIVTHEDLRSLSSLTIEPVPWRSATSGAAACDMTATASAVIFAPSGDHRLT